MSRPSRWLREPLNAKFAIHSTAKIGNAESENEDSFAAAPAAMRFAIADGASTSARAEKWSRMLVDAFVYEQLDPTEPAVRQELTQRWLTQVWHSELPWFAQEKILRGSAATFAGLTISDHTYRVRAVGDSCLFHLREGWVLLVGPVSDPERFDRFPELLQTTTEECSDDGHTWEAIGSYHRGDHFVLATDSAAATLLADCTPSGLAPLRYLRNPDELVSRARTNGHNDDMTICVIEI